jgi:lipid-A-disaccharide synthase
VARLAGHPAITGFVLPTLPHLEDRLATETADWAAPIDIVTTSEARREAFGAAVAALASTGTVTLELALMDVPFACTYVPDFLLMRAYKRWGRPMVGLPNIILGEEFVPEVPPDQPEYASRLAETLTDLLDNPETRAAQRQGFEKIRQQIVHGLPEMGRSSAASRILERLGTGAK